MIGLVLSLALSAAPQQPPQPQPGPPASAPDVVLLDTGTELEGRILRETADYIELELDGGTVVGFDKSKAVSIVRGTRPEPVADGTKPRPEPDPPPAAPAASDGDTWFLLHDGRGRAVGWLHGTTARDTDGGGSRIGEEWRFFDDAKTIEITVLEVLAADGAPRSCFYHERIRHDGDDRVREERLVRAVVEGANLVVTRKSTRGERDERRTYEFSRGTRFPLEARAELRRRSKTLNGRVTHLVFDPRHEEFVRQTFDVGRHRRVEVDGARFAVRVLTAESSNGRNSEWLDASLRTVRREINGPSLVAVPTTEAVARRDAQRQQLRFPAALRVEPAGRFAMWLPNPMWSFVDSVVDGQISARAELEDAGVSLVHFDQLDAGVHVESAADAVLRWLKLVYRDLVVSHRARESIRGAEAVRVVAAFEHRVRGQVTRRRMTVHVFWAGDLLLALCCDAPATSFELLAGDFDRVLATLELHRGGFAPRLQGPLERRGGRVARDAR